MGDDSGRQAFVRASWANVIGNAAKIVVEGAVGIAFGSIALVADAAHSVGDLIASVVVLVWGESRFDDPDADNPHGHARIEPLTALFVGAVIVLLGLILLYESAHGLLFGVDTVFNPLLIGALVFAMVNMYLVYRYTEFVNASIGSTALDALAVDCLNDLYTSIAAFIGVIGLFFGYSALDPIAGGVVSLLVIYQGIEIARENVTYLVGAAPSDDRREEVREKLVSHPAVYGVHDLTVYYDGTDLEVETHVEVDGELSVLDAHDIETDLVTLLRELDGVGDAHVHLDPSGIGEWRATDEVDEA
jgi:cation diffusion facilitator family transporter